MVRHFFQSFLIRRKTREMKKVERILRGSDCRELIEKSFGSVTPDLLESILALDEQKVPSTKDLTPDGLVEEGRETVTKDLDSTKDASEKIANIVANIK
ncbi:hypothetical protein C0J52_03700 [Blattella germanica]|nr:hypothetical protein C0J52_03700 [Blattella germanica]